MTSLLSAFTLFRNESGRIRTGASADSYRQVVQHLSRTFSELDLIDFTDGHLTEFCLANDPAPSTIRHRRAVLQALFDFCYWKGLIPDDPSLALKYTVSPGTGRKREQHWLTETQVADVLRACPATVLGQRDRVLLMFGFLMGLRLSTLAQLSWGQVGEFCKVLRATTKGRKQTELGIPEQLQRALQAWIPVSALDDSFSHWGVLPPMRSLHGPPEASWGPLLGPDGIRTAVRRAGERAGIPNLAPHDMRRTFASILETQGYPVTDIQRALGHASVGTTSVYLDQNPARTRAVTEGLTIAL